MDSPQYITMISSDTKFINASFKPYYKWIVLNTFNYSIINFIGIFCFKHYYKWIVLNTLVFSNTTDDVSFGFKPYYKWIVLNT